MKTAKLLAFALLVSSVSFAQLKEAKPVGPVASSPTKEAVAQTPSQLKWDKDIHMNLVQLNKENQFHMSLHLQTLLIKMLL